MKYIDFTDEQKEEILGIINMLNSPDKESKKLGKALLQTCDFLNNPKFKYLRPKITNYYDSSHAQKWTKDEIEGKDIQLYDLDSSKTVLERIEKPSVQKFLGGDEECVASILLNTLIAEDHIYSVKHVDYKNSKNPISYYYCCTLQPITYEYKSVISSLRSQLDHKLQYLEQYTTLITSMQKEVVSLSKQIGELQSQVNIMNDLLKV